MRETDKTNKQAKRQRQKNRSSNSTQNEEELEKRIKGGIEKKDKRALVRRDSLFF